jgi:PEP-CTERM motif-containing protein
MEKEEMHMGLRREKCTMKVSHLVSLVVLLAAVLGIGTGTASAELLTNPGFDNAGAGWGSFGAAGFNDFFGGNEHASFFSDGNGNFGGVFQGGIAATPGTTYQFDLTDVRIEPNTNANYRFGLEYYQADDATKIGEDLQIIPLNVTGNGLSFSMTATAPNDPLLAFIRPIILFDNAVSAGAGQENVFVFDASLVPEPASLGLLAAGLFAMLTRHRR